VYKELACFYSPVLNAAFTDDRFLEGDTQTYTLEDVSTPVFEQLVQWLNTEKFDDLFTKEELRKAMRPQNWFRYFRNSLAGTKTNELPKRMKKGPEIGHQVRSRIIALWILADRLQIPSLQNLAIDALARASHYYGPFSAAEMLHAYENTSRKSSLRRFLVASAVQSGGSGLKDVFGDLGAAADPEGAKNTHFELALDFNIAQQRDREGPCPFSDDSELGEESETEDGSESSSSRPDLWSEDDSELEDRSESPDDDIDWSEDDSRVDDNSEPEDDSMRWRLDSDSESCEPDVDIMELSEFYVPTEDKVLKSEF
jgi:hypothetical protein